MTTERDVRQSDIVDEAVGALRRTPVPETPPADVVAAAMAAGAEPTAGHSKSTKRRIFTMTRIAKIAAAIVIVAGIAGAFVWVTVGEGGTTVAWADVQRNIANITTMRFSGVMTGENLPGRNRWWWLPFCPRLNSSRRWAGTG